MNHFCPHGVRSAEGHYGESDAEGRLGSIHEVPTTENGNGYVEENAGDEAWRVSSSLNRA